MRASINNTAAWAVDAPVAMLRVYCSCPGVSATMKRRLRRGEKAIGNIDRDLLLTFRLQAVDEQSKIETLALRAEFFRVRLERLELIFEDQLASRRAGGRSTSICRRPTLPQVINRRVSIKNTLPAFCVPSSRRHRDR